MMRHISPLNATGSAAEADHADELVQAARQLWPAPASVALVRADAPPNPDEIVIRDLLVVPRLAQPRLLVPSGCPRAAAAAVRSYAHGSGIPHRLARSVAAGIITTRLAERVLQHRVRVSVPAAERDRVASLENHLRELLRPDAVVGIRVGSPRANRKPVLPVMGRNGDLLAYVKVGHNDLTRELVRREGEALAALATLRPRTMRSPRVLHSGSWRDLELLVMSPLDVPGRRWTVRDALPAEAMSELATSFGVTHVLLVESPFWHRLSRMLRQVAESATADRLRAVLTGIAHRDGRARLPFGTWHGDWAPWNMARGRGVILLWDWERFAHSVPVGFDALHYRLQADLAGRDVDAAATAFVQAGPAALEAMGVREHQQLMSLLYLSEISLRYVLDAQGPTGEPLREIARWSVDLLTIRAAHS